jgi:hypothetical protein
MMSTRRFVMTLTLASVTVVGCHGTGVREVRTISGTPVYEAKCKSSGTDCLLDARETCHDGYELIDSDTHAGGLLADLIPGPVTWYSMTFTCSTSGQFEHPSFAFRGPVYEPPDTAPAVPTPASAPPAVAGARAGAPRCSSDADCGGPGYACAKPAGSFTGECARAVNQYGTQDFSRTPQGSSLGPGRRQCWTTTDCPIGFSCNDGVCLKR